ncbi:NAD(P)-dependent dehydrogenase, short-chain alcohol dehydrogenase family [Cyclonatronum proteinivorum]|uniref:NAD(P)-dependent dehydrogenase, short-chain alcohol dehydrogenase family n=1 Tax=Cyclonatronum proteinivorum TaxID=1457365 RepID=A0A345UFY4_9BACT|nr:SDR family oxidoreductase [Cyclonatronum proteinivorum]AXI99385.1 NAD(P)-dependent dehydrogenase, short-chain alcohol dehydrogenase family [Cyclonatronum proteinivorum]
MKKRMQDKVALITGGAGGIGLETAVLFIEEGAQGIHLVDLDEATLKEAVASLPQGSKVTWSAADVSLNADVERYTREAIAAHGKIDVLFLNAGIEGKVMPITEYPEELFDKVMAVNVKSIFLGLKHAIPHLRENGGGSVMITSSVAGWRGTPNVSAYVTSKHATLGIMKSAALELAADGIRVNSIHPSPVDNRMMRSLEDGFAPGKGDEVKAGFEQMIPLGRYATNREIAEAALFLASDESRFLTGTSITVDGGLNAK